MKNPITYLQSKYKLHRFYTKINKLPPELKKEFIGWMLKELHQEFGEV